MTRPLPKFSAAAALLAALAITSLWPCTYSRPCWVHWTWRNIGLDVLTVRGVVKVEWITHNDRSPWSWSGERIPAIPRNPQWAGTTWSRFGFAGGTSGGIDIMGGLGPFITTTRFVVVPVWALALPAWAIAVPLCLARRSRERETSAAGPCETCGDGARPQATRCPACGRAATAPSARIPSTA